MKNTFRIIAGALLMVLILGTGAMAEVDLSGMSYNELVELKDRINKAIWDSAEWQEVTVPQGIWLVGEDIPAGHWTIKPCDGASTQVIIGTELEENGREVVYDSKRYYRGFVVSPTAHNYKEGQQMQFLDFTFIEGDYVEINISDAVFTPYSGKPSLGFK